MEIESRRLGRSCARGRGYDIIDGKLKYGYIGKNKFEFIIGNKYKVLHQSPAMVLHKGAVGVYKKFGRNKGRYVILECCGKNFTVAPESLIPYEGEIAEEHVKLITPVKKVHLFEKDKCACKCDSSPNINPMKLCIEEFLAVPENSRCTNCNRLALRKSQLKENRCQH